MGKYSEGNNDSNNNGVGDNRSDEANRNGGVGQKINLHGVYFVTVEPTLIRRRLIFICCLH
jgi:hypothetical protein